MPSEISRPIAFSDEMIRALLDGRKTETRRPLKPQPNGLPARYVPYFADKGQWAPESNSGKMFIDETWQPIACPYGVPGDLLLVKEAWKPTATHLGEGYSQKTYVRYRADDSRREVQHNLGGCYEDKWRPSIHMPRQASRLTLEITGVGVELVQAITEKGAKAEGVWPAGIVNADAPRANLGPYRASFSFLWDSIYAKRGLGWDSNPWVWVVAFKVLMGVRE